MNGLVAGTGPIDKLGRATFTIPSPSLGKLTLMATYSRDNQNAPGASHPMLENITLRPTSTTLSASPSSISAGKQVILVAVVTPNQTAITTVPSGSISCMPGLTVLGTVPVTSVRGQASYTADGPGSYIAIGAIASGFQADLRSPETRRRRVFLDANPYRRVGIEAEYRTLRYHATQSLSESSMVVGPKIYPHGRDFRPYAMLLVGRGHPSYPYSYAQGSYFAIAPGAGLDWRSPEVLSPSA